MGDLAAERRAGELWSPPDDYYPINITSVAYESVRVARAGPGRLYGFTVYNSGAAQFILIFDANAPPAAGAVPVVAPFAVAATANLGGYWGSIGRWFNRGVVIANSSTGPTYTAGAADCWFDVQVG